MTGRVTPEQVPSVDELREATAAYVRATEPNTTSRGMAEYLRNFLLARAAASAPQEPQ